MPVMHGRDYVLAPSTTYPFGASGVVTGFIVGLPDRLVMLPKGAIGGQFTIRETTFGIGGAPLFDAVAGMLGHPHQTLGGLAATLEELAAKVGGDALVVRLPALKALRVKTGWFSRGIYWKLPEHTGWRALPLSGKEVALAFHAYYAPQLREG